MQQVAKDDANGISNTADATDWAAIVEVTDLLEGKMLLKIIEFAVNQPLVQLRKICRKSKVDFAPWERARAWLIVSGATPIVDVVDGFKYQQLDNNFENVSQPLKSLCYLLCFAAVHFHTIYAKMMDFNNVSVRHVEISYVPDSTGDNCTIQELLDKFEEIYKVADPVFPSVRVQRIIDSAVKKPLMQLHKKGNDINFECDEENESSDGHASAWLQASGATAIVDAYDAFTEHALVAYRGAPAQSLSALLEFAAIEFYTTYSLLCSINNLEPVMDSRTEYYYYPK